MVSKMQFYWSMRIGKLSLDKDTQPILGEVSS